MSASDTSIFNQKNGTDEKPKAWLKTYGSKSSFLRIATEKKNWSKIFVIIKKSKHKKHPTIAKIDSHVDENGQLVVDCPDLWAGNSNAFYRVFYRFYLPVLIGQSSDWESWFWVARYFEMHFSLLVSLVPLLVTVIFIPSQLVEKYFVCFMHWPVFHFSTFFSEKSVKVFTFFFCHVMLEANYHIIRRVFYWFHGLVNCDNKLGNIGWKKILIWNYDY